MLVFALRSGRRLAMPLFEVDRLEDFPVSAVEHSDRMQVVQYRDQIMPLIELADVLAEPSPVPGEASGTESTVSEFIKAVVIRKNGHSAAIAVEDILDVGQQMGPIQMMNQPGNPIRGSIVIEGKVTDVLDVPSLVRIAGVDLINAGK